MLTKESGSKGNNLSFNLSPDAYIRISCSKKNMTVGYLGLLQGGSGSCIENLHYRLFEILRGLDLFVCCCCCVCWLTCSLILFVA